MATLRNGTNSRLTQLILWKEMILMNKKQIGKYLMMGLGGLLMLASEFVNAKNQDNQIKDAVAEQLAEALKNQAKGS